ncbi:MAG: GreA/GreB family elongation factor [Bacteroidaceae bacterium]|nr:GreA/GreB family elongation factor [Bacteroidaceae bacterium]
MSVEYMSQEGYDKLVAELRQLESVEIREGKISVKSPIAQALLNKEVGDVVEVRVPAGTIKLRIENIQLG